METRAHHVLIGLFTLIIFTAVLLFSLWLTKSGTDRQFKQYDIVFNEAVSGLSQGSTVNYSGIRVGEVTMLRLIPTCRPKSGRAFGSRPLHRSVRIPRLDWQ